MLFIAILTLPLTARAQQETSCDPFANLPVRDGDVIINYGSATNSFSFRNRSDFTIAQPLVGSSFSQRFATEGGFWSRFLLPPQAPVVMPTQGDFPDRVLIKWTLDPLSSFPDQGYVITRDGAFLAEVNDEISQYIDFNVQAGEFYEYAVEGRNQFGTGAKGKAIGFVNPNGTVNGTVQTISGNPVSGAIIKLEPSFGNSIEFDGINDHICLSHNETLPTDMWTLSTWVKVGDGNNSAGIIDLGSSLTKNFWLKTTSSSAGKGIVAGCGDGSSEYTLEYIFPENEDDWHHIAVVYSQENLLLYIDGAFASSRKASIANEEALFTFGSLSNKSGFFKGMLDDIRIYNRPLTSTEIFLTQNITVPSNADGLVGYWKTDEGMGQKIFDITENNIDGFMFGPTFSDDSPEIMNAGITDGTGFYSIEGINYSKQQTFRAIPEKIFYQNFALEMNAAYQAYADLTAFDLPDSSTVDITFHPYDIKSKQTILSNGNDNFVLGIENGDLILTLQGQEFTLGPVISQYQQVTITLNASNGSVEYYNNGIPQNVIQYSGFSGDWSGHKWQLGAVGGAMPSEYYSGLIDEVAFYRNILDRSTIEGITIPTMKGGTDVANGDLLAFFSLDEGDGDIINDYGPLRSGIGMVHNTSFSIITLRQDATAHKFRPSARSITINPSNTAATDIDFIDESTVAVSGVVRFENTFCYQDSVEILVNGESAFPRIFTDEEGRFVADFEPGASVILTPSFRDHKFSLPFFEIRRINRPIAGVLFQNQTKRTLVGQLAGNETCRKSIIPSGAIVKIKVQALDDCFSKEIRITNEDGKYTFSGLPPIPFAVAVTEHSNNIIYDYFQVQGGKEVDLRQVERDTVDFVYIAPPQVYIETFKENGCPGDGLKMIEQSTPANSYRKYKNDIRVFERYDGGLCYLDSFKLIVDNDIADTSRYEIMVDDTSTYPLSYWAGPPNINGDYTKFLQVTADVNGAQATSIERVVVLGERSRESTFTTASPALPLIILRDPPGDGSFSSISEGSTHCQTWSDASLLNSETNTALNIDLGAKVITYAGSPFGGIIMESEQVAEIDITGSITTQQSRTSAAEFCVTSDIEYNTSDRDDIFFDGADLFVGAAVNFEFSATDVLSFNPDDCSFELGKNVRVWPEGFGTKYIYSKWQIETDVIPSLEFIGDTSSAESWRRILTYNDELKQNAIFRDNISFDAINSYSESFTTESSSSLEIATDFTWELGFNQTLGFEVFDVGSKVSLGMKIGGGTSTVTGSSTSSTRSVSYTLADDDPNDNYTIDILDDPVFGTPVFRLKSGESMCPWEPGTLNREEVGFGTNRLTAVNVPANEPATFELTLSNQGQTGNDAVVYILGLKEGSNPDGAIVEVDGAPLAAGPIAYQLQPFSSIKVLLTISRGPDAYSYNDIGIFMASECMWEHSRGLGYDLAGHYNSPDAPKQGQYDTEDLRKFYREFKLDVEFLEPCSPIDIGFPLEDWVMTPADGDMLFITLNDYDIDDPDLELIRVQYRRTGGDGAWINIAEIPADSLQNDPVFRIVPWDMSLLSDGPYEIRAITQCFDVTLNPGISTIVKGRKETRPPELLGSPEPSDGLLSPGDEISITFTKRINCDRIFQADGIGKNININNLALMDMTLGGVLIDATISCSEDKIVIVPNVPNQFIENHNLKVIVDSIQDFYGNKTGRIEWEFFVNRSNLYWLGGDINEIVMEGKSLRITRDIRNQSGQITNFNLSNIPGWLDVYPRAGSVAPGEAQVITFEFPSDLIPAMYETTINMETIDGIEPLDINIRVACPPPSWEFDPAAFSYSMNFTVQLDVEGEISEDELDIIAAFVDGEIRGMAYLEYDFELEKALAYLTVYSDVTAGETIEFQIWDASECLLYTPTVESFPFVADDFIGSPLVPQVIHTNNLLLRTIKIHPGWNWISYNVELMEPGLDSALVSLHHPENGLIKSQTRFSSYSSMAQRWLGSLTELSHLTMYQYNTLMNDSIILTGMPVDPSASIPINQGWNWIGYLPQRGMPVTNALESLSPLNGDIIKGQLSFAQFVQGIGWVGNLSFLEPLNGYLLRISNSGILQYPDNFSFGNGLNRQNDPDVNEIALPQLLRAQIQPMDTTRLFWKVDPANYEFSMNLIAVIGSEEYSQLDEKDELGAFYRGVPRGSSQSIYIPFIDAYLFFVTIYANREDEIMEFRFYDSDREEILRLEETIPFQVNRLVGEVDQPFTFHPATTGTISLGGGERQITFFPNPVRDILNVEYQTEKPGQLELILLDVLGHAVDQIRIDAKSGTQIIEWSIAGNLPEGIYMVLVREPDNITTAKIKLER